jgi:hypothetical protein
MNRCLKHLTPMLLAILPGPIRAATPNEADFPVQYEVMSANLSWHLLGDTCTLTVRDLANPSLNFSVEKKSDTCEVPKTKILHGRRVKSKIQLLMQNYRGKPTVVNWAINEGASANNPK